MLLELSQVLAELGLHLLPHIDETALDDIELTLLLCDQAPPLACMFLEQVFHFFLVLFVQQLAPKQELLFGTLCLSELLHPLLHLELLSDRLGVFVVSIVAEDFDLPLHVKHLSAVVNALAGLLMLYLLPEHLDLVLLPLLQLELQQRSLVLEVGHDDTVPLRQQLLDLQHVCFLEGGHLLVMTLEQILALTVFLQDFEFLEPLPGRLRFVQFTLALADLPVLVEHLEKIVSDEVAHLAILPLAIRQVRKLAFRITALHG